MMVNRPMTIAYRVSTATYQIAKHLKLVRPQLFSLPNILAGELLVPELIQHEATADRLAAETSRWLESEGLRETLRQRFLEIHDQLRCNASEKAAEAVCGLLRL